LGLLNKGTYLRSGHPTCTEEKGKYLQHFGQNASIRQESNSKLTVGTVEELD
jgi:hypothetical protein